MQAKTLFEVMAFNTAFPAASRQAIKGLTGSLNFSIAAALSAHLREERKRKPEDPSGEKSGPELETQAIDEANGQDVEDQMRQDQGHDIEMRPLEVAKLLKAVRDHFAADLEIHAGVKYNPATKKDEPDQFHMATPFENSLEFRATPNPRIDRKALKEMAELTGADESAVEANMKSNAERQAFFAKRESPVLLQMFMELEAKGEDGHALEAEACFDRLPAIYQARIFAAADRACHTALNAAAADGLTGMRKDALADTAHLNGLRWEIRDAYAALRKVDRWKREYEAQIQRNREPSWLPEPKLARKAA